VALGSEFDNVLAVEFTGTQGLGIDNLAVPEPATLALMGLGLAGIGWKRRKAA